MYLGVGGNNNTRVNEIKIYKGIDLIEKIIEFVEMTPNSSEWTYNSLKENEPRLIRLKQINSLISAFIFESKKDNFINKNKGLFSPQKVELQSILNGDFLENRNFNEYFEFIHFVKKDTKVSNFVSKEIDFTDLKDAFLLFVSYKKKLRQLLEFNSRWLSVSRITSFYTIQITSSISSNLIGKYTDLDDALEMLINPKNLSFTETELISNYSFPKENLEDIDSENW